MFSDLCKEVLMNNFKNKNKNRVTDFLKHHKPRSSRNFRRIIFNRNIKVLNLEGRFANVSIVIWKCCSCFEIVYKQDLSQYENRVKCDNCSKSCESSITICTQNLSQCEEVDECSIVISSQDLSQCTNSEDSFIDTSSQDLSQPAEADECSVVISTQDLSLCAKSDESSINISEDLFQCVNPDETFTNISTTDLSQCENLDELESICSEDLFHCTNKDECEVCSKSQIMKVFNDHKPES